MKYDPNLHHRRSIRLPKHDYSEPGMYSVTMCVRERRTMLGEVTRNGVVLSEIGEIVRKCWLEIPTHFPNSDLDEFVVMPNHFHGILILKDVLVGVQWPSGKDLVAEGNRSGKGFIHETPTRKGLINQTATKNELSGWPLMKDRGVTLGKIIRAFKAKSSKVIHDSGYAQFAWQRNYYEHIIRDGQDLDRIRRYILDNPANWTNDDNFPWTTGWIPPTKE